MRRARLLSAVVDDGLSVSVPAEVHGGPTEDLRMLRVRLLNCMGDRHIAEQLRTAGTVSVCHDWDRPLRVSLQFWEHILLRLLAVTNGIELPEPPAHFLDRREKEVLKRHEEILALLRWKEEELRSDAGETVWSQEESQGAKQEAAREEDCPEHESGRQDRRLYRTRWGKSRQAKEKMRQTEGACKGQARRRISGSRPLDADRSGCTGCCHTAQCA